MRKLSRFLNFLIFTLILIISAAFYYLKATPEPAKAKPALSEQELDNIVNKNIKKTVLETQIAKSLVQKSLLDTQKMLTELEKLKKKQEEKEIENIPRERQIWKDVQNENSPLIENYTEDKSDLSKMNEQEKKEYAREWIQNALREGYLLELSPSLEVIRYTPIRKPSQLDDSVESFPSD